MKYLIIIGVILIGIIGLTYKPNVLPMVSVLLSPMNHQLFGAGATLLIGDDTIATDGSVWAENYNVAVKFTAAGTGSMNEFRVKGAVNGDIKVAIYADNAGSPGALLNSTGSVAVVIGANTIVFPSTGLTSGTAYWLAFNQNTGYRTVATKTSGTTPTAYKVLSYASTFPNPFGTPDGTSSSYNTAVAGYSVAASVSSQESDIIIFE